MRSEREVDVWLDHLAHTRGLAGASVTQLDGGRFRVVARLATTENPSEQVDVTSPGQLALDW
ncbi:hypothetical protein [Amycolatopsis sp. NBC_01286]|uniref:hypothetical protein n=1 Tax=Amycolatopsis sp. NBC_01286 TaxID=2903560 RepID=UPI002E0F1635|nr:hypothetical protein OG570_48220 [Amycolatopsis sp. NBC_01286]